MTSNSNTSQDVRQRFSARLNQIAASLIMLRREAQIIFHIVLINWKSGSLQSTTIYLSNHFINSNFNVRCSHHRQLCDCRLRLQLRISNRLLDTIFSITCNNVNCCQYVVPLSVLKQGRAEISDQYHMPTITRHNKTKVVDGNVDLVIIKKGKVLDDITTF